MKLSVLNSVFAICRLPHEVPIPGWALASPVFSISKTSDELSIVCEQSLVPAAIKCERDWRMLKIEGPLDFALSGVLASLATPLAEAKISIFAISTFDTDYLLVGSADLTLALSCLRKAGHDRLHP